MNDAPAQSHEYPAPPPYRPLSGGAITALILAILLGIAAFFGPWWLPGVALLVAALSWPAISAGRRRGAGLAIAAFVLALAAGGCAYYATSEMIHVMQDGFGTLMTAMEKDDRKALSGWVLKGEEPGATMDAWHARYEAVKAEAGEFAGSTLVRTGIWGPYALLFLPPSGLTEVGDTTSGAQVPGPFEAVWFEAVFQRARVQVALVCGARQGSSKEELSKSLKEAGELHALPIVREIRYFKRAADGS